MLQQGEPKDDPLRLAAWGRGVKAAGNNGSGLFPKMSLPAHLQGLLASNNSNSTSPEEQVSKARFRSQSPKFGFKSKQVKLCLTMTSRRKNALSKTVETGLKLVLN